MENQLSISKSFLSEWKKYHDGTLCGYFFYLNQILKTIKTDPSDAMLWGQRFEYLATGAKLRDGSTPGEILTKTGKPSPTENARCEAQAQNWKKTVEKFGIEIISTGRVLQVEKGFYRRKGILDVECRIHKMPDPDTDRKGYFLNSFDAVIDLKSSGQMATRWGDYAWDIYDKNSGEYSSFRNKLLEIGNHWIQPVDYKSILREVGEHQNKPFYWFIASSSNDYHHELIEFPVHDDVLDNHTQRVNEIAIELRDQIEKCQYPVPFAIRPDYRKCMDCPVPDCPYSEKSCKSHVTEYFGMSHYRL
ncbi:MAG: hypothetical protein V1783_04330 [Bacteroidota bacterium]